MIPIALTNASLPAKKRILTVCVKLFLEKGYRKTTLGEILKKADVSCSTFQNIFRAKDGVLTELVEFMFSTQFAMARTNAGDALPPAYVYAVETALQLTLTELNENLRIFGAYLPDLTARDFYHMEIGSAGVMRGYMARPCDEGLTLEKKIRAFLTVSLRVYRVPQEEIERIIRFVEGMNVRAMAERVMHTLFEALAMRYEFSLAEPVFAVG